MPSTGTSASTAVRASSISSRTQVGRTSVAERSEPRIASQRQPFELGGHLLTEIEPDHAVADAAPLQPIREQTRWRVGLVLKHQRLSPGGHRGILTHVGAPGKGARAGSRARR